MKINDAVDLLEFTIKQNRVIRNYDVTTDYEESCEKKCRAAETVLHALETSQEALRGQDEFILELFGDIDLSDALKGKYVEKYNKLQISTK